MSLILTDAISINLKLSKSHCPKDMDICFVCVAGKGISIFSFPNIICIFSVFLEKVICIGTH